MEKYQKRLKSRVNTYHLEYIVKGLSEADLSLVSDSRDLSEFVTAFIKNFDINCHLQFGFLQNLTQHHSSEAEELTNIIIRVADRCVPNDLENKYKSEKDKLSGFNTDMTTRYINTSTGRLLREYCGLISSLVIQDNNTLRATAKQLLEKLLRADEVVQAQIGKYFLLKYLPFLSEAKPEAELRSSLMNEDPELKLHAFIYMPSTGYNVSKVWSFIYDALKYALDNYLAEESDPPRDFTRAYGAHISIAWYNRESRTFPGDRNVQDIVRYLASRVEEASDTADSLIKSVIFRLERTIRNSFDKDSEPEEQAIAKMLASIQSYASYMKEPCQLNESSLWGRFIYLHTSFYCDAQINDLIDLSSTMINNSDTLIYASNNLSEIHSVFDPKIFTLSLERNHDDQFYSLLLLMLENYLRKCTRVEYSVWRGIDEYDQFLEELDSQSTESISIHGHEASISETRDMLTRVSGT